MCIEIHCTLPLLSSREVLRVHPERREEHILIQIQYLELVCVLISQLDHLSGLHVPLNRWLQH